MLSVGLSKKIEAKFPKWEATILSLTSFLGVFTFLVGEATVGKDMHQCGTMLT